MYVRIGGPCLLPCGILDAYLICLPADYIRIQDVIPTIEYDGVNRKWNISIAVWMDWGPLAESDLQLKVKLMCGDHTITTQEFQLNKSSFVELMADPIDEGSVERWWPNGLGKQSLYQLDVSVSAHNVVLSNWSKRIAFRKVKLVQVIRVIRIMNNSNIIT